MKVSHEVPIGLLDASRAFNDYDYCLPHFLDKYPKYEEYFREAKQKGRYIIMDNSLHELGKAYDTNRLLYWINELKPNEFIIPDVWEDAVKSMRNAKEWNSIELPEGVKKVAVVQGESFSEAVKCYHTYKLLGYEKIAFSYGADYFHTEMCPHPNRDMGKALGRVLTISKMIESQIINNSDEIHLLGCSLPQEFLYYKDIKQIKTIDTSNPIMAAFDGTTYKHWGLDRKPITIINDIIGIELDDPRMKDSYDKIRINTDTFKLINNIK